jgi:hypothetical protein
MTLAPGLLSSGRFDRPPATATGKQKTRDKHSQGTRKN